MKSFQINTKQQYQYPILPTGCEVTATSILFNYLVENHSDKCKLESDKISKETLANIIIKEQDPIDKLVGNPYRAFVGSPYSKDSFGTFSPVITELVNKVILSSDPNSNLKAINLTIKNEDKFKYILKENETKEYLQSRLDYFEQQQEEEAYDDNDFEILKNHMIAYNMPIVIWMTLELKKPHITDEWFDVKNTTQHIYWVSPEHCATLSGFDENTVTITDPHTGKIETYPISLFLKRWRQLGRQAVSCIY